jgi:catechol 2,3-dioxygenase-like lactoylglutathione lyase family enzyme
MSQRTIDAIRFESVSPVFHVSDVTTALAFYCVGLGFNVAWKWGQPATHASVCRGSVSISLTLDSQKAGTGDAYIEVGGIDSYHEELATRGVPLGDLADRPYGMRDFAVIDPSGNRIVFGQATAS